MKKNSLIFNNDGIEFIYKRHKDMKINNISIQGFLNKIIIAFIAYQTFDKKPGRKIYPEPDKQKPTLLNAAEVLYTLS